MAARYPSRLSEAAKPSIYGPLGPARRRPSVFGAAKYVSNIVSACDRPLAAGSQSSARTPISRQIAGHYGHAEQTSPHRSLAGPPRASDHALARMEKTPCPIPPPKPLAIIFVRPLN